jgi:hypothetical protein
VNNAKPKIANVLKMLLDFFPREEGTNGYCIPKMHETTKFQSYMKRYGSAMIYFGGIGEAAHKFFVKATCLKTQRRVSKFAIQTANQYYDIMVTRHALRLLEQEQNMIQESSSLHSKKLATDQFSRDEDEVAVKFSGKYSLHVTNNIL